MASRKPSQNEKYDVRSPLNFGRFSLGNLEWPFPRDDTVEIGEN